MAMMGNERNSKQCHYCKNIGYEIEECNINTIIHGIILRETRKISGRISCRRWIEWYRLRRTRGRECRIAEHKKFLASLITTIFVEGLFPELVFMLDSSAKSNFIKARSLHSDMQILRKDRLHLVDVTNSFIESLGSLQVSLVDTSTLDVVPDNSPILQEGILGTDFLKSSTPIYQNIRYDVQGFIKWHGITIPCIRQNPVLIPVRTAKVLYIKKKNPKVRISGSLWRWPICKNCINEESWRKSIY